MKNFFPYLPWLRKALLAALVLAVFPPLLPTGVCRAAGLAEEHNILYYLVEVQRRFTKNCNGAAMPEAPSLNPSSALRGLAEQSALSDRSPADFASANGLAGIPLLAVRVQAGSPREAFERMNAAQCANLMKPDYLYIGAARSGDQWTVFLAGAEPGSLPANPDTPGVPAAPGAASGAGMGGAQTAPTLKEGAAIVPAVAAQDAATAAPAPGAVRDALDPHAAAPVPADVVILDASGRPVGAPQPVEPPLLPPGVAYQPAASGGAPAVVPAQAPPPPAVVPSQAPPPPAVAPAQAPSPPAVAPAQADPGRGAIRDALDPHAAAPVPTAVVILDASGRPVGAPQPIDSSFCGRHSSSASEQPVRPGQAPLHVPQGGAGPVNDPHAAAAPVVTHEFMVDPIGRVIGPFPPGASPSGAASPCVPLPASR